MKEYNKASPAGMNLDGFLRAWGVASQVTFARPGISDRTVLFVGQVLNVPKE